MRKLYLWTGLLFTHGYAHGRLRRAAEAAVTRSEPTLEQRVTDLEAYINNTARLADTTNNVGSKLGVHDEKTGVFSPGPVRGQMPG